MDQDLALALKLQEEFDREHGDVYVQSSSGQSSSKGGSLSLADESWELMDPNPDIRALFLQYNDRFFWGRLAGIEVKWSPRMTLCAGLCVYEGRCGLCSVRLSLPLLKLRPRRDLVQTLLHEMIHAYLFVTDNNKDHDGHGPEFHKHMYRINKEGGVNITVYHTFHDEVAEYRQHWWRCNGPCQSRKPYFGYVKRAMNRPPGPRDPWFKDHQNSCNGTFIKVKEPENYGKKKKKDDGKAGKAMDKSAIEKKSPNKDIRTFFGKGHVLSSKSPKKNNPSESLINSSESPNKSNVMEKTATNSKNLPKFYDTDSDDELFITDPHKKLTKQRNSSSDLSFDKRDLPEAILRDLLSDSDDELLCGALETQENTLTSDASNTRDSNSVKDTGTSEEKDTEICDNSSKSSTSIPSTSKASENVGGEVQNKLREIWGKKFQNPVKNKTLGKVSGKRPLTKPEPVPPLKKIKSDKKIIDLTEKDNINKNVASRSEKNLCITSSTEPNIFKASDNPSSSPLNTVETDVCKCPVCNRDILATHINQHLDMCLGVT